MYRFIFFLLATILYRRTEAFICFDVLCLPSNHDG